MTPSPRVWRNRRTSRNELTAPGKESAYAFEDLRSDAQTTPALCLTWPRFCGQRAPMARETPSSSLNLLNRSKKLCLGFGACGSWQPRRLAPSLRIKHAKCRTTGVRLFSPAVVAVWNALWFYVIYRLPLQLTKFRRVGSPEISSSVSLLCFG
jgi:hypothetical protein